MKYPKVLHYLLLIYFVFSFASCQRDLIDPFIPVHVKHETQFKFSKTRNRTVERHSGLMQSKGRFKDSFGSIKRGGSGGGFGKDSFSFRPKKRNNEGGFGRNSYSFRVGKRNTGGGFGKDSYSFRTKKKIGGGFGRDTYSARAGKRNTGGGFGKDSYSFRSRKNMGGGFANDSYSARHKSGAGLFKFSKAKKRVVSRDKFVVFGAHRHMRESGFFSGKHRQAQGEYKPSGRKKQGVSKHFVFGGLKNMRSSSSFNVKVRKHYSIYGYNAKKKKVTEKFLLRKPKDLDPGTFGHGKRGSFTQKQYYFDKKSKKVKKRDNLWWDLNQSFNRKKYKKHALELELFDPTMRRKMKLGT